MKVLIYSSTDPGILNLYTISRLMRERRDHEYVIVKVRRTKIPPAVLLFKKMRSSAAEILKGRNYFDRDGLSLRRRIVASCPAVEKECAVHFVNEVNGSEAQTLLRNHAPDIMVQAGAGILRPEIFSVPKIATLNIHHGIAPEIRGIQSTFWALYYGLHDRIGVTCHCIDESLDTGPVVGQYRFDYRMGTSWIDVQYELCHRGAELLVDSIDRLARPFSVDSTECRSFYFGCVDKGQYNALRSNGFNPLSKESALKGKTIQRKALRFIRG